MSTQLDIDVAEKVFGFKVRKIEGESHTPIYVIGGFPVPGFSEDFGNAFQIVKEMAGKSREMQRVFREALQQVTSKAVSPLGVITIPFEDLIFYYTPKDICVAALMAMGNL